MIKIYVLSIDFAEITIFLFQFYCNYLAYHLLNFVPMYMGSFSAFDVFFSLLMMTPRSVWEICNNAHAIAYEYMTKQKLQNTQSYVIHINVKSIFVNSNCLIKLRISTKYSIFNEFFGSTKFLFKLLFPVLTLTLLISSRASPFEIKKSR